MALENQPFFRSPSVPKLGRRNISSSIFSNASKLQPQLKTSTFSFLKPIQKEQQGSSITDTLTKVVSGEDSKDKQIYSALVETNRILVEIQKQLSLDFGSRITEKKKSLGSLRATMLKKRAAQKEKAIESVNNDAGIIRGAFDKITAPAKGIFDRIIEFVSTIATGFVVNAAFGWLSDKKNRQKLLETFEFLTKHWKWIVGIIIGAKLVGAIIKIIGFVRKFKGLVELIRRVWGKPPTKPPGGGSGPGNPCQPLLQCMGNPAFSAAFVASSIAALIANQQLTEHIKRVASGSVVPAPPSPIPAVQPTLQQQYRQSRQGVPAGGYSATNVQAAQQAAGSTPAQSPQQLSKTWDQVRSLSNDPEIQAILASSALLPFVDGPFPFGDVAAVTNLLRTLPKLIQVMTRRGMAVARSKGGTIPKEAPKKKCDTCSLLPFFSGGGTVGGRGSGNVDSVPAMLAPGEEVIRTSSANLFRPLLKDINDNAGTMWLSFKGAIEDQEKNNARQASINTEFSSQLDAFNKELDGLIRQEKQKKIKDAEVKLPKVSQIPPGEGTGKGGPSDTQKPPASPSLPTTSPSSTEKGKSMPSDEDRNKIPPKLPPTSGPSPTPSSPPSSSPTPPPAATTPAATPPPSSPTPGPAPITGPQRIPVEPYNPSTPQLSSVKSIPKSYAFNTLKSESASKITMLSYPMPPITMRQSSGQPNVSEATPPPTAKTTNRLDDYISLAALEYGILT